MKYKSIAIFSFWLCSPLLLNQIELARSTEVNPSGKVEIDFDEVALSGELVKPGVTLLTEHLSHCEKIAAGDIQKYNACMDSALAALTAPQDNMSAPKRACPAHSNAQSNTSASGLNLAQLTNTGDYRTLIIKTTYTQDGVRHSVHKKRAHLDLNQGLIQTDQSEFCVQASTMNVARTWAMDKRVHGTRLDIDSSDFVGLLSEVAQSTEAQAFIQSCFSENSDCTLTYGSGSGLDVKHRVPIWLEFYKALNDAAFVPNAGTKKTETISFVQRQGNSVKILRVEISLKGSPVMMN